MKQIVTLSILAAASAAIAGPNLITNGSFEQGTDPGAGFITVPGGNSTTITGWTVGGDSVDYIGGYWQASDGKRSIDLAGNNQGDLFQMVNLIKGQSYHMTFDLAGNPDGAPLIKSLNVGTGTVAPNFFFDTFFSTRANMMWQQESIDWTSAVGGPTKIDFRDTVPNSPYGPALDNVNLQAVPEPVACLTLLGGVVVTALRRRK